MTESTAVEFPKSTTVRAIVGTLRGLAFVQPSWAARAASYLFFRAPPRRPERDEETDAMSWGRELELPHAAGTLRGRRWGAGPTILLVHGWGGSAAQMTAFVRPLVEAGFEVVALDFAGHGYSPGTQGSIPDVARTVLALARQLGEVKAVVAHSLGVSASLLALELGLSVQTVVAIAGPARPIRWFESWVGGVVSAEETARERSRVEAVFGLSMDLLEGPDLAVRRSESLLWIHDEGDKEVPFAAGKRMAEVWPNAVFEGTEGLGHRRILRDEAVVKRVVGFLADAHGGTEVGELAGVQDLGA